MATTTNKESLVKLEHYVYSHITKIPGVCGGKATLDGRRVRVMDIVVLHQQGETPEQMLEAYDFLNYVSVQYIVGGLPFSLDDIEHGVLRANRGHPSLPGPQFGPHDPRRSYVLPDVDPRLHMALNCAARSCPPIAAYDPTRLDQQLDLASTSFINGGAAHYDPATDTLELSRIFKWYARDFGGRQGVQAFLRRYAQPPLKEALAIDRMERVRWQRYDWAVNA